MNHNSNYSSDSGRRYPGVEFLVQSGKNAGSCPRANSVASLKGRLFAGINDVKEIGDRDTEHLSMVFGLSISCYQKI
jgi:hypothetical protein